MATAARVSPITAEELLERPDDDYKYELVDGELIRMSPTGAEHGVVTANLSHSLREYVNSSHAGVCCGAETGFILQRDPDVVRAPDAAYIARERIPATGVPTGFWPFAPDFAVEVASPSDRFTELQTKVAEYFRRRHPAGVDRRAGHPHGPRVSGTERAAGVRRGGRVDRRRRATGIPLPGTAAVRVTTRQRPC